LRIVLPLRKTYNKIFKILLKAGVKKSELPPFQRPHNADYEFIGECLLKIATHLARKGFFGTTPYKEEMIGDAVLNAILYLENFDVKRGNPFAYFTQIMTFAFYRRISGEEQHKVIRQKCLQSMVELFDTQKNDNGEYNNTYIKFMRELQNDTIEKFEAKKNKKKKPGTRVKKKKEYVLGVEKFMVSI